MTVLETILKLKREEAMPWREIAKRIGKTAPGARYMARSAMKQPCCPACLRPLEKTLPIGKSNQ